MEKQRTTQIMRDRESNIAQNDQQIDKWIALWTLASTNEIPSNENKRLAICYPAELNQFNESYSAYMFLTFSAAKK